MDSEISSLVIERFTDALGLPPGELDLDTPLEGEDWEEELIEDICRDADVSPDSVFPLSTVRQRSELALLGLRHLAPFSRHAARRLQDIEVRWEVTTIRSFIRSLEERRPVASGRWITSEDQPIPPGRSIVRFGAWTAALALPLTFLAWGGCDPSCRVCPTLPAAALKPGLALSLALVGGWHLLLFVAASRELGRGASVAATAPSGG